MAAELQHHKKLIPDLEEQIYNLQAEGDVHVKALRFILFGRKISEKVYKTATLKISGTHTKFVMLNVCT